MRNGQNNKRMRNRNNNNNSSNNNNNNRRGQNPMTRVFESNGPDIKIRGTASHVAEKYVQLARDARSSGDPVAAENYYQHAEHYFRLIAAAQEQFRQNQPQPRPDAESNAEDGDEEENFSNFGQEPGFVPQQQQPYVRENAPQPQPQPQPQPVIADSGSVDRLPSFITGGAAPPVNNAPGGYEAGGERADRERFPRRRRRPHGPRPEGMAAPAAPSEDFNPGNE
jgi:type II secretory pathway pseudopilin PulG